MELQLRPLTEPAELEQLVVQKDKIEEKPRKVKAFYKQQNRKIKLLVQAFRHLKTPLLEKISDNNVFSKSGFTPQKPGKQKQSLSLQTRTAIVLSFFVNILLLLFKGLASFWSGSYSVIASTIDSLLDIVSGSILFAVEMCSARRSSDWYKYPQGKSRLEPLGVIVFSVAMAMVSLQLISTGAQQLAKDLSGKNHLIKFDWVTISIFSATILVKVTLFVYTKCVSKKTKSPAVGALAKDHLNDTMTSFTGFVAVFAASKSTKLIFLDSVGMILLAIVIFIIWFKTAKEQICILLGKSAPEEFIAKIIYISAHYHPDIVLIDKVLAYHFGIRYLVEVDIVLPPECPLSKAHDIGEGLEIKIESLESVERAFVHLDFETTHKPEHKTF